jgi:hypothetical protein
LNKIVNCVTFSNDLLPEVRLGSFQKYAVVMVTGSNASYNVLRRGEALNQTSFETL